MFQTFVGRTIELETFKAYLQAAIKGERHLAFLAGDAGIGKTRLIQEFCRRAEQTHDDLVVAFGACSTLTEGVSTEPYQPFKDIFQILTSGPDRQVSGPTVTAESRRRIHRIFGRVVDALAELGPDLVGLFVPVAGLLTKIGAYAADRKGWIEHIVAQPKTKQAELSQDFVFEQFSRVVLYLASQFPMILVLDDLQWADHASLNLLFYLARRAFTERLLIVGAYRATDIQQTPRGEAHPLGKVLNELQRYFGDITLDLNKTNELEGRAFIDALLDSEPNGLGEAFRVWLCGRTAGQPLFTIEVLHDLNERGLLVQDEQERWTIIGEADLESLPMRVEAVIAERISRLNDELRSILACGSVMGETFTAEVISRVAEIQRRSLLQKLTQLLERRYHLVQEGDVQTVNGKRLHFFKFAHALFRQFVYGQLGSAERETLHLAVGQALELLYDDEVATIASQLAQHFHLGYDVRKAAHYYAMAGDQAADQYANDDAVAYYTEALGLTQADDMLTRFNLLAAREMINELRGDVRSQYDDLQEMAHLVHLVKGKTTDSKRAYIHNRKCLWNLWDQEKLAGVSKAYEEGQRALSQASLDNDKINQTYALNNLGRVCHRLKKYEESIKLLNRGLRIYEEIGDPRGMAHCLAWLGLSSWYLDERSSLKHFERALTIRRELGDKWALSHSLRNMGGYFLTKDLEKATDFLYESFNLRQTVGDRRGMRSVMADLAILYCYLGKYDEAEHNYGSQKILFTDWSSDVLPMIHIERGDYCCAIALLEEKETQRYSSMSSGYLAQNKHMLGRVQLLTDNPSEARGNLEIALRIRAQIKQTGNWLASRALFAQVLAASNEAKQAFVVVCEALERLEKGSGTGYYRPQEVWFDCYKAMTSTGPEQKALQALQQAHELVVNQAARLTNPEWRKSFLTNVRLNREIEAEWRKWNR